MSLEDRSAYAGGGSESFRPFSEPLTMPVDAVYWYEAVKRMLPAGQYVRIFNRHTESTIVLGDCEQPADDVINLLRRVKLKDNVFFTPEPPSESTDFYVQLAIPDLTLRLRDYGNGMVSWIIASDKKSTEVIWKSGTFTTTARPEQLLVLLPDIPEDAPFGQRRRRINRTVSDFFMSGSSITKIVTKKKYPGNFGEEFMWKHRTARIRNKAGEIVPLLPDEPLLNMDQYIAIGLFDIREIKFTRPVPLEVGALHARMITKGIMTPSAAFDLYYPQVTGCKRKIEIECGPSYFEQGAYITQQILPMFDVESSGAAERTVTSSI